MNEQPSLLVVVPRAESEACRRLQQTLEGPGVRVVLDRRDHVDAPYVEQLPLLTALEEIVPQTSFLAQLPRPLHTLITMVLSTGGARRVVYSEASDLPGLVGDIVARGASVDHQVVEVGATMTGCNCDGRVSPFDVVDSDRPAGSEDRMRFSRRAGSRRRVARGGSR